MTEATTVDPSTMLDDESDAPFFAHELTSRQKLTRRMLRLGIGLVAITIVALATQLLRSVPATAELPPAEAAAMPVTTFAAKRVESYARQRSYTGLLRESRRSQLSFQRGGELLELLVDEDDVVVAGQAIGRLDARHIRANRALIERTNSRRLS